MEPDTMKTTSAKEAVSERMLFPSRSDMKNVEAAPQVAPNTRPAGTWNEGSGTKNYLEHVQ
jgi:hypothetical protein